MRAQRRDRNEPEIRKRAEALGFLWLENNASTKGRPDVCLLRSGQTYWCEVKEPGASYTPAQVEEFPRLIAKGVPVYVLEVPEAVDLLAAGWLKSWSPSDVQVVRNAKGRQKTKREHRPGYDRARYTTELCSVTYCRLSKLPHGSMCEHHISMIEGRETASVENGLLPAPRKARPISPANPPEYEATKKPTLATQMDRKTTPRKGVSEPHATNEPMRKHDWRGGSAVQHCGNVGCDWKRLPLGIGPDRRIRYTRTDAGKAILKAHPCVGKTLAEVRALHNAETP